MGALVNMTKQGATVGFAVVRTTLPEKRPSVVRHSWAWAIASHAVASLIDEVRLTPKPGLVDARGSGSHNDVSLEMFERSAEVLRPYFALMALAGAAHPMGVLLREKLGAIGRCAEKAMLVVTDGVNTHRGAIWTLGLLCAAAASPKRSRRNFAHGQANSPAYQIAFRRSDRRTGSCWRGCMACAGSGAKLKMDFRMCGEMGCRCCKRGEGSASQSSLRGSMHYWRL